MKVWILESGEYSDRKIQGAFSKKEIAEQVNSQLFKGNATIHELEVDEPVTFANGLFPWVVELLEDGSVWSVSLEDWHMEGEAPIRSFDPIDLDSLPSKRGRPMDAVLTQDDETLVYVWARNGGHAVKIASDKWFRFKAQSSI